MTDDELRALALKIAEGKVVGTWIEQIARDVSLARMVFMPLTFATQEHVDAWKARGIGHFYAVLGEDETSERAIDGLPIFWSMHAMTGAEYEKLGPLVEQAVAVRKSFLGTT